MSVWKREGSLEERVEKRMGGVFRHGTCTGKSSCTLPSSLAQTGTRKTHHTSSSNTSQLLAVQGARKSEDHKFLSMKFEWPTFSGSVLDSSMFNSALPPTHRLNLDIPQLTGFSLCGCSYCNLLIFCPFWLHKIQISLISIMHKCFTLTGLDLFVLNFGIVYSSFNTVFL